MESGKNKKDELQQLKSELSDIKFELEDLQHLLNEETEKRKFYQLISDFTFGWELWFDADRSIKYCSPSCFDLTGFTSNQIIAANSLSDLLVYEPDATKFDEFLKNAIGQTLVNQSLEFRILTRTKQLLWCNMAARGVYNSQGRYLGVRASIQNITRLKKAMGSIRDLTEGNEYINRTQKRLQNEISLKDRELVSFLLQLSQKNELLNNIYNLAKNNGNKTKQNALLLQQITQLIEAQSGSGFDWGLIENQIQKIRPGFWERLYTKHPGLTFKDKKLCAYLLLKLSSKQISGLLGITAKSVEIARVRLRKKLKLKSSVRLVTYLEQI